MQILIDEDNRILSVNSNNIEWSYPDPRWTIIDYSKQINFEDHDNIDYIWNGEEFVYSPKVYK